MLPTLSQQTVYFLASIAFGAALAVLYGVIRLFRYAVHSRTLPVILSDIFFFIAAGVLTSLFSLPFNKGEVRGFIIVGELIGFLTIHLTLGSLCARASEAFMMSLGKFGRKISKIVKKLFEKVLKFMHFILYNISELIGRIRRKVSDKKPKYQVRKSKNEYKRKKKNQKASA